MTRSDASVGGGPRPRRARSPLRLIPRLLAWFTLSVSLAGAGVSLLASGAAAQSRTTPAAGAPRQDGAGLSLAVVFDGSGSMWGRLDGATTPKFEGAREALRSAISAAARARGARLGVFGFGFSQKGSCGEAETVTPFGSGDADTDAGLAALEGLNPRGRGPLAHALTVAGDALRGQPAPRAVILIHDDDDNCREDICAVAARLRSGMPDLRIHAMTLQPAGTAKLMACLERAGGVVRQSNGADRIGSDVGEIVTAAFSAAGPPPAATPSAPAARALPPVDSLPAGTHTRPGPQKLVLQANLAEAGPRVQLPLRWSVTAPDGSIAHHIGDQIHLAAAPGVHRVAVAGGLSRAQADVEVAPDVTTIAVLSLRAGAIAFGAKLGSAGPAVEGAAFEIRSHSETPASNERPLLVGSADERPVILPEGSYLVTARRDRLAETIRLDVARGANQTVPFELAGAKLTISIADASGPDGTRSGAENPLTVVETRVDGDPDGFREIARSSGPRPEFHLPAGAYRVTAIRGAARASRQIVLGDGEVSDVTLALRASPITLATALPNGLGEVPAGRTRYVLTPLDSADHKSTVIFSDRPTLALAPGRYSVESIITDPASSAAQTITVAADAPRTVTLSHAVGRVSMAVAITDSERHEVDWEVRAPSGDVVWRSLATAPTTLLPPGRYTVAVRRKAMAETVVTVVAGETTHVRLEVP